MKHQKKKDLIFIETFRHHYLYTNSWHCTYTRVCRTYCEVKIYPSMFILTIALILVFPRRSNTRGEILKTGLFTFLHKISCD